MDSDECDDFCPLEKREENAEKLIHYFEQDMSNGRVLYNKLMSYIWRFVKNKNDREEIVCKLLLNLVKGGAKTYRYKLNTSSPLDDSKLIGWLYMDIRNLCIDNLRTVHRRKEINYMRSVDKGGEENHNLFEQSRTQKTFRLPGEELIEREDAIKVRTTIQKLNKKDQKIISLRCFSGMKYGQIAENLNIPIGTVKSRINTIKKKIKGNLEQVL